MIKFRYPLTHLCHTYFSRFDLILKWMSWSMYRHNMSYNEKSFRYCAKCGEILCVLLNESTSLRKSIMLKARTHTFLFAEKYLFDFDLSEWFWRNFQHLLDKIETINNKHIEKMYHNMVERQVKYRSFLPLLCAQCACNIILFDHNFFAWNFCEAVY